MSILQGQSFDHSLTSLFFNSGWLLASYLWSEIVRDIFHILGHRWPWLRQHHRWHHVAYGKGFQRNMPEYRKNLWHHELPEAVLQLLGSILLSLIALSLFGNAALGSLFGCWLGLKEILIRAFKIAGFDRLIQIDTPHDPTTLWQPPAPWRVNASYHWRHHFENPQAYFCGVFTLTDRWLGTALSLKGKTVAIMGQTGALGTYLEQQLNRVGAKVVQTSEPEVSLDTSADILLIAPNVSAPTQPTAGISAQAAHHLMKQFMANVRSDADVARKEVWCIFPEPAVVPSLEANASLQALDDWMTLERITAPCILRKIILEPLPEIHLRRHGSTSPAQAAKQIVLALQQDTRNIVISQRPWLALQWGLRKKLLQWQATSKAKSNLSKLFEQRL